MYTHSDKSLKALITLTSTITLLCALHQMRMAEIGNLHKFHTRFILAVVLVTVLALAPKAITLPLSLIFFFFFIEIIKTVKNICRYSLELFLLQKQTC